MRFPVAHLSNLCSCTVKDVRAKIFFNTDFFSKFLLQSDNELPNQKCKKKMCDADLVFEMKRVENYPNFDKSVLVTRHGLSGC